MFTVWGGSLTMLTSDTMSMLATSILMPTATGAPVMQMQWYHLQWQWIKKMAAIWAQDERIGIVNMDTLQHGCPTFENVPPKSGRRRISYPFSSLSTVSFTKDMFPGSFTLKQQQKDSVYYKIARSFFRHTFTREITHLCAQQTTATITGAERTLNNFPLRKAHIPYCLGGKKSATQKRYNMFTNQIIPLASSRGGSRWLFTPFRSVRFDITRILDFSPLSLCNGETWRNYTPNWNVYWLLAKTPPVEAVKVLSWIGANPAHSRYSSNWL